jgi:hypothetical protein
MLALTTCSAKPTACLTFCLTFFEKDKFFRQIITISQTFWLFSHKIVYFKIRMQKNYLKIFLNNIMIKKPHLYSVKNQNLSIIKVCLKKD